LRSEIKKSPETVPTRYVQEIQDPLPHQTGNKNRRLRAEFNRADRGSVK
jgi:hypothetical protein